MSLNFKINNDIGFIEFDQKDSKVNLLTMEMVKRLDALLEDIKNTSHLKALVILSNKKDVFIAGADIKEIESITEVEDGREKSRSGQKATSNIKVPKLIT